MYHDDSDYCLAFQPGTTFNDGTTISDNFGEFDVQDSRSMQYLIGVKSGNVTQSDVNKVNEEIDRNGLVVDLLSKVSNNIGILRTERQSYIDQTKEMLFDCDGNIEELKKFLRMYVNYKKTSGGIHLYFNYFNYLDTPYVRISDGKCYPNIIPNTYLHLKPNETGCLSFVTQFRCYSQDEVVGISDVELASLQIYNVSDDKPKFIVRINSIIERDSASVAKGSANVDIKMNDITINTSTIGDRNTVVDTRIFMIKNKRVNGGYTFGVEYPHELMNIETTYGDGFVVESSDSGYAVIRVDDGDLTSLRLQFSVKLSAQELKNYIGKYRISTVEDGIITGINGNIASVTYNSGSITII